MIKIPNVMAILRDCGNLAHLIVAFVEAMKDQTESWDEFKKTQTFPGPDAKVVYAKTLSKLEIAYGKARWHQLVSPECKRLDDVRSHTSWNMVTIPFMKRVAVLALSKQPTDGDQALVRKSKITLNHCKEAGMLRLDDVVVEEEEQVCVNMPLLALSVMDNVAQFLPLTMELTNPFGDNWQTLERIAMASLYIHLHIEESIPIQSLRPGASWYISPDDSFTANQPKQAKFLYLSTYLTAKQLLSGKNGDGGKVELSVGLLAMTTENEYALDGIAIFEGMIAQRKRTILWLSQSKAMEEMNKRTGEPTESTLYDGSIKGTLLPKMKQGCATFKAAFPQFQDAFVVYDIFSNRSEPKTDANNDFTFDEENEALVVTRAETLDQVLGGLAVRKRNVPPVPASESM
jgi:hypothetical protein